MRILVFTTDTPHHVYYVNRINAEFPIHAIYCEEKKFPYRKMYFKNMRRSKGILAKIRAVALSPYLQLGLFDRRAIKYEKENFFKGATPTFPCSPTLRRVYDVNSPDVVAEIEKINPDVILVFGTLMIKPPLMYIPKYGMFNVHRGSLPEHRGWDSHLWAIHFGRYDLIATTIHFITEGLDTGDIVARGRYTLTKRDKLYHLRFHTTVIAVNLTLQVLRRLQRGETPDRKEQKLEDGITLSFMPLLLKLYTTVKFYLTRKMARPFEAKSKGGVD